MNMKLYSFQRLTEVRMVQIFCSIVTYSCFLLSGSEYLTNYIQNEQHGGIKAFSCPCAKWDDGMQNLVCRVLLQHNKEHLWR